MKQLTATNNLTGMTIIQRYIEGIRYLKVTPTNYMSLIVNQLKAQFKDREVNIETSETGWIKIEKTGEDKKLQEAGKKVAGDKEIDETYILNKEAEMLKSQGYAVKIEEIE